MNPNQIVASNITRLRTDARLRDGEILSRAALARRCGWTDSKVLDLEHGRDRTPGATPNELLTLCRALEVTLFELLLPSPGVESIDMPSGEGLGAPYMELEYYISRLFGMSHEQTLPEYRWTQWATAAEASVRRDILEMHPIVFGYSNYWIHEWDRHYKVLQRALFKSGSHTMTLVDDDGWETLAGSDALAHLDQTNPLDVDQATMSLASAWAEEDKLRQLVEQSIVIGIEQIERLITAGTFPNPPVPDVYEHERMRLAGDIPTYWLEQIAYPWLSEAVDDSEWLADFVQEYGIEDTEIN